MHCFYCLPRNCCKEGYLLFHLEQGQTSLVKSAALRSAVWSAFRLMDPRLKQDFLDYISLFRCYLKQHNPNRRRSLIHSDVVTGSQLRSEGGKTQYNTSNWSGRELNRKRSQSKLLQSSLLIKEMIKMFFCAMSRNIGAAGKTFLFDIVKTTHRSWQPIA